MDSEEVCWALNITKRTLQSYRDRGAIPCSRLGGKFYYRRRDLAAWLSRKTVQNAIAMPLDYLNEASDEIQRLFARLDDVERMLRKASEERRPMIGEERYLTGEEVCTRLRLSPRTLQTLRDRRQIPFTVLGNRLLLYPESGIRAVLDRNLRPAAE